MELAMEQMVEFLRAMEEMIETQMSSLKAGMKADREKTNAELRTM
jgi:hypothetical protein